MASVTKTCGKKKKAAKRSSRKVRKVAWNNRIGQSIEERPEHVNQREEFGYWEIDLVVGRQGIKPAMMTKIPLCADKKQNTKRSDTSG